MYAQVMYCLDRVPALVKAKPELAKVEPFKTVLSGDREAIAQAVRGRRCEKILAATLTGMSVEEFQAEVKKWLAEAKDPRWKKPYTELTYLPMQEVLKYLRAQRLQDVHRHGRRPGLRARVLGSDLRHPARAGGRHRRRHEVRLRQGRQAVPDQGAEAAAQRRQGRQARGHPPDDRPPAGGGVRQLRPATSRCWSTRRPATARGWRCWCCTTTPSASTPTARHKGLPATKVGTFTQALYDQAQKQGWTVISMKNDWKRIFSFE